ncbi:hypothetical protein FFLO_06877 [Filobasidium floriforme]|uniref:Uncharacterized protein n=1 Tax=Filobasidium floriforme TaxID=5210 RepID=A0A8K0JFD6_9TREE|nr:uncharacterized protein HD553DRAFT_220143 [Filobasidium floriforme]KAG7527493.1 hypothetical protein FFLO_06877 [Filobasidium floriforme]KAH8086540.1 hypothetical protein HD553DRAFT_220143 [Filobasidium floriforme]
MPSRLRRTRSSAFRAHAISSPNKTAGRPAKKLKLDRSGVSVSAKSVLEGSDVDEDDDENIDEDEDENEDEADGDDDVDEESNSDEGQENIDPTTDASSVNPGAGPSRRRLRNGKNVLKRLRSRRQRRPAALTTASAYNHSYSPRKRKRDDPEYTDEDEDDEDRASGEEYTDDEAEVGSDEQAEAGLGEGIEEEDDEEEDVDVDDSAEPDYIDENDEHLLREAPAWTLRRLKKAELKRLWLVAGLWDAEDGMGGDEEGEVADGLTKDVLVEGIIKARNSLLALAIQYQEIASTIRRSTNLLPRLREKTTTMMARNNRVKAPPPAKVREVKVDLA